MRVPPKNRPWAMLFGHIVPPDRVLAAIETQEKMEQVVSKRGIPPAPEEAKDFSKIISERDRYYTILGDTERLVFDRWRASDESTRQAIKAVLTDPPGGVEW